MLDVVKAEALIKKYELRRIYFYPDYPEKQFWTQDFSLEDYSDALISMYSTGSGLLYIHMPYCHTQCLFCNCKTIISLNYKKVQSYLSWLYREIELHADFMRTHGLNSNITHIHLGGGSPTYLNEADFSAFISNIKTLVNPEMLREISLEIDPRRIHPERMHFYHSCGINRISFGVQDLDPDVQRAIDRIQPDNLIRRLLTPEIRALFPNGVNFDVMCGLPKQTRETFRNTIEKVIDISPDRLSLLTMNIVPDVAPHQLRMPLDQVPDLLTTKLLLNDAIERLCESGYVQTGYEHLAKPDDGMARAREAGKLGWGSFGPADGDYQSLLGLGTSSFSHLGTHHAAQNVYELEPWEDSIRRGRFPVLRGHVYSQDDIIRREVILGLRSHPYLFFGTIEDKYSINFNDYFSKELRRLSEFEDDGLVVVGSSSLEITEFGHLFADYIATAFDAYFSK